MVLWGGHLKESGKDLCSMRSSDHVAKVWGKTPLNKVWFGLVKA